MMRILAVAAIVIAAVSFEARPVLANEAPWCAVISLGPGAVYWDCQYATFEACRPNVLAGNRGFCNVNPEYVAAPPRSHVRKKRVARS